MHRGTRILNGGAVNGASHRHSECVPACSAAQRLSLLHLCAVYSETNCDVCTSVFVYENVVSLFPAFYIAIFFIFLN